jgi:hypothetical protein
MAKTDAPCLNGLRRVSPKVWVALVLALVVLIVYCRVLDNGFVNYDDGIYVTDNPNVKEGLTGENIRWAWTTFYAANWHPLTWLSLQSDAQ